ncbi:carbohydrate kinase family protein [Cetobacterium sp. 2G large]|uniref:carbohydrate kinase family protein n=1 Tax=Cetobacterium sp. 2G large TaxID=2759680 RepID=UPI00163CB127|nr:carbohydrate kinase family protein [Cetobacterium sp. 2G large]MBC2853600.1 carbohydrate kinase family protein [Cetobacterium sp. 2G large]
MQDCLSGQKYILVFGASVVDMFGFCNSSYKACDSIPGKIKISFGGVSRNIAENMARVGVKTKFISIIGDDEIGRSMLTHSLKIGYDMRNSLVLEGKSTPTYMAILDESGEMVSAVADLDSISAMTTDFIDSKAPMIENAAFTFLDADDPENLEYLLTKFQGKTNFILDPISSIKAEKVKHLIKYFHTIKPNRVEAEVLSGIKINTREDLEKVGTHFLSLGIKNVFISLDADGIYYTNGVESGTLKATGVTVKNVTGAGDSFVAGLGFGYMHDLPIKETVKFAMAMSIVTISHEETIHPNMGHELIQEIIAKTNWNEN